MNKKPHIVVIGAGLGGLAAAISCASKGFSVTILEKNDHAGGKCNTLTSKGFRFDLGPSILLLPDIFRNLYRLANEQFENHISLIEIECQWRNFFEDGRILDLYSDRKKTEDHIENTFPGCGKQYQMFYEYAQTQFRILNDSYLNKGIDTPLQMFTRNSFFPLLKLDMLHTMHSGVCRFFKDTHLIDIFDYFIKYVGSSAYRAPGFMNLLSGAQCTGGLWYIKNGIYSLVQSHCNLLKNLGGNIRYSSEVTRILVKDNLVTGVELGGAEKIDASAVISNMEIIPTYTNLLKTDKVFLKLLDKFESSCSGLVLHLGLDKVYTQLAHHNFFYSNEQKSHFKAVFEEYRLPDDPTVYVVAPSRTDPDVAPAGYDNLKILPHIPHIRTGHPIQRQEYEKFAERVLQKLERMGLEDLRKHILFRDMWTPEDFLKKYYSTSGSIYGTVTDLWKNFGFKAAKRSSKFHNLFFVGGSINPGGGMPMVTLGGIHTGNLVYDMFC